MLEIWKSVIGYEGLYEVSNFGRVRSLEYKGKKRVEALIIGGYEKKSGYLEVVLYKNKKKKYLLIHRLVVEAFILGRKMKKGEVCDHINTIKTDNRVENLRVCSQKQNCNNPLTIAKIKGNTNGNKQLDLIEIAYPHREFTFRSSRQASKFFGYKDDTVVRFISYARKSNSNIIRIKGKEYYYAQEKKGVKANV